MINRCLSFLFIAGFFSFSVFPFDYAKEFKKCTKLATGIEAQDCLGRVNCDEIYKVNKDEGTKCSNHKAKLEFQMFKRQNEEGIKKMEAALEIAAQIDPEGTKAIQAQQK